MKLNKSQVVAVALSLGFLTYLLFSQSIINLFNIKMNDEQKSVEISTGFTAQDIVVGTGEVALAGDIVTAHYVGTLSDGRVFDSSRDRGEPISFTLGVGQVIRGWDEGIKGMRVGGKRILKIAPDYGYGSRAVGTIPADSVLNFEVELLKVEKSQ